MAFIDDADHEENCLYHRVSTLPLVQPVLQTIFNGYDGVKHLNPTIEGYFDGTEKYVQGIYEAPIYQNYGQPIVRMSSQIGAKGLIFAENTFPAIRETTPADVKNKIVSVYDNSPIKKPVDAVSKQVGSAVVAAKARFAFFLGVLATALDYAENSVDHYVAFKLEKSDPNAPWYVRVYRIPYRCVVGLYTLSKEYGGDVYGYGVSALNEAARRYETSKKYVVEKKDQAVENASYVVYLPANMTLWSVKTSTSLATRVHDQMLSFAASSRFMPQFALKPLEAANAYLHEANNSAEQTDSLTDLASRGYNELAYRFNNFKGLAFSFAERFQSKAKKE